MTAMCVGKHVSRIGALIYGYFIQLYVHLHRPAFTRMTNTNQQKYYNVDLRSLRVLTTSQLH